MKSAQHDSPFHQGEHNIQQRLGVRESMERFGRMVIRDHMPEQHRIFYQQLPFIVLGHSDPSGAPWASIVSRPPGFIESPSERELLINAPVDPADPLFDTLEINQSQSKQTKLGLLGIELPTRRRNRLSAHVSSMTNESLSLVIEQSFGNCPQYIQARKFEFISSQEIGRSTFESFHKLDKRAKNIIESADTFFIASAFDSGNELASDGADVSHRGGRPGFVKVQNDGKLVIPDYRGNNHFNTFGNIEETGKAGLLFVDFNSGELLTLTGNAKIIWDSPEIKYFEGAQRLLEFEVTKGRFIKNAIAARWSKPEYSPNSLLTGTWAEASSARHAEQKRQQWLDYQVESIADESKNIRSFYLKPTEGNIFNFKPGQFLTIRLLINGKPLIRTYTISSATSDGIYRISVKRDSVKSNELRDGIVSNYLHNKVRSGQVIQAKAPAGNFVFETDKQKPALLVAAGIGITPMISMLRQSLIDAIKTRYLRPITLIAIARNESERAFYDEIESLVDGSNGQINVYWCLTEPENKTKTHTTFNLKGRPSDEIYRQLLPSKQTDVFLCGTSDFMQQTYDMIRKIGLSDHAIHAESFGPSSLERDGEKEDHQFAKNALVTVYQNESIQTLEQQWSDADGSLLEFLESHGVQPTYGCRSGQCGSCKATLANGKVEHYLPISAELDSNEVLLCCAKPAASSESGLQKLAIHI
ncbi:MAG: pyridoxamine 5'-phosphate oxidase family protein [Kangiellaceae bacterium]|nr:pyridoxamine 5'-phosphate oxidase family protein [Kangiellaceae bacterium]